MRKIIEMPHRVCLSTCYINGLEDIFEWNGQKFPNYFLSVMGGMGEFTYLKLRTAEPPEMVYCGANPKYLLKELEEITGYRQEITENRSFRNTLKKIRDYIDDDRPVMAGALDMYYLPYYKSMYGKQHIPIHYILIVGYDDNNKEIFLKDCSYSQTNRISFDELEKALNINLPAMSKRNTIRTFILPEKLPNELEIAKKGLKLRVEKMLNPPSSIFGIPAMKKLAAEILDWQNNASFEHLITYATIPPHIPKSFDNSDGMRQWKTVIFKYLGEKYNISQWKEASIIFSSSGEIFKKICQAASLRKKETISKLLLKAIRFEEKAYRLLSQSIEPG